MSDQFFLITFEWKSGGSSLWRRENEAIKGCPGVWWANYLRDSYRLEEAKKIKFAETGALMDAPSGETYRFVCAIPITEKGFDLIDSGWAYEDDDE
jgi:hypothetical protein